MFEIVPQVKTLQHYEIKFNSLFYYFDEFQNQFSERPETMTDNNN